MYQTVKKLNSKLNITWLTGYVSNDLPNNQYQLKWLYIKNYKEN